ncbi:MAG: class I SAM-dependent methyltransferase [Acidobacteria bacterium]|uniref:Class I SAM-dependent methyltransferase n=1 Tax=Candidatus Polarisedimenticola svalbardensis TaxID=2886004 RepID=A0A8J6Y818_9BACT|nr:class I SAM-dependent methyltransferase [Candidatus Polarisedimenticola svalbardensis]
MEEWKKRLYDTYVTSGQAGAGMADWDAYDLSRFPFYRSLIRTHVPSGRDLELIDLACGHGGLVFCLNESGYRNVHGVDISPEQVELAHRFGLPEVECGGIVEYLDRSSLQYDVVFLLDILEHLTREELLAVLDRVSSRLNPQGRLIITVPNGAGLFGMRVRYGDLTHENCYTPQSMEQALRTTGFGNVRAYEIRPVLHGLKSAVRHGLWRLMTLPHRLLLAAETGEIHHILTQNMLVTAGKPAAAD